MSRGYTGDHPIIRNMERTGYPDGKEPGTPICPECGNECETVYINRDFKIVGCDVCLTEKDAWEAYECFPEEE